MTPGETVVLEIIRLRMRMEKLVGKGLPLTHPAVLAAAEEVDARILEFMRRRAENNESASVAFETGTKTVA